MFYGHCPKNIIFILFGTSLIDIVLFVRLNGGIQSYKGELMKPNFYPEDKNKLTIKEEIELLKAISEADRWPGDAEIDELSLPEYYLND